MIDKIMAMIEGMIDDQQKKVDLLNSAPDQAKDFEELSKCYAKIAKHQEAINLLQNADNEKE
jgi:hypothetical protein